MSLTIPKGRGITLLLILNNASNLLWISCRVVSLSNSLSLASLITDAPVCFLACGGPDVSSDAIAYTFRLFCLQNCNPVSYDGNQIILLYQLNKQHTKTFNCDIYNELFTSCSMTILQCKPICCAQNVLISPHFLYFLSNIWYICTVLGYVYITY